MATSCIPNLHINPKTYHFDFRCPPASSGWDGASDSDGNIGDGINMRTFTLFQFRIHIIGYTFDNDDDDDLDDDPGWVGRSHTSTPNRLNVRYYCSSSYFHSLACTLCCTPKRPAARDVRTCVCVCGCVLLCIFVLKRPSHINM